MARALVSVVIPVWNGEATVGRAIESALGQRFDGAEIVVVNDGSTDTTASVLGAYAGRIQVIAQPNRGLACARNAGAAIARGEYLAFLDDDDVWLPDKLTKTIDALQRRERAVLAYSDAQPIDVDGSTAAASYIAPKMGRAPSMEDLLRGWWPILPSTVVMRRATFDSCGGFCEEFRRAYEDVEMWLRARQCGEFEYVAEALVLYRLGGVVARMERYAPDYQVFARRVSERYGAAARELLRSSRRAYATAFSYRGLLELSAGSSAQARGSFAQALRYQPLHLRSWLRLARTLIPARMARALSGRTKDVGVRG